MDDKKKILELQQELLSRDRVISHQMMTIQKQGTMIASPAKHHPNTTPPYRLQENRPFSTPRGPHRLPPPSYGLAGKYTDPRHPRTAHPDFSQPLTENVPKFGQPRLGDNLSNLHERLNNLAEPRPSNPVAREVALYQPASKPVQASGYNPQGLIPFPRPPQSSLTSGLDIVPSSMFPLPVPSTGHPQSGVLYQADQRQWQPSAPTPKHVFVQQPQHAGPTIQPPNLAQQLPNISGPNVKSGWQGPDSLLLKQIVDLFSMVERYCYSHANFPSATKDGRCAQSIKDKLMNASSTSTAHVLLNTPYTRYLMIAAIVNGWLCKHILKPTCFMGFSEVVDKNIAEARAQIYQSTPPHVRCQLLTQVANEINGLRNHPGFADFFNQLCRNRGNDLWAMVKPLMHQKTTKDWDDLFTLMQAAHKLAGAMYCGPNEWRFDFPEAGTAFRQDTMINKDRLYTGVSGAELERRGATIKLAYAPTLALRSSANGNINTCKVFMANVLLK